MANDIDMWNDVQRAERICGENSKEAKQAMRDFLKAYPSDIPEVNLLPQKEGGK